MKELKKIIRTVLNEAYIDKDGNLQDFTNNLVDFDSFPPSVLKTLENEYDNYYPFDWNKKMYEFRDDNGNYNLPAFHEWINEYKSEKFIENIDNLIKQTTQDMILKKKQKMAQQKLEAFEQLLKDGHGSKILAPLMSKFEEDVLMNPWATPESISQGFKDAKNIIDQSGNIESSKMEKSTLFDDMITFASFEKFVEENPEYQKSFDAWQKLYNEELDLMLIDLHAFRNSTSIDRIRELRNFLISYKKKL